MLVGQHESGRDEEAGAVRRAEAHHPADRARRVEQRPLPGPACIGQLRWQDGAVVAWCIATVLLQPGAGGLPEGLDREHGRYDSAFMASIISSLRLAGTS